MHASNGTNGRTTYKRVKFAGLSALEEARLRERLRRQTPSEPWVDVQIVQQRTAGTRGEIVVRRHHDPSAFPPGGSRTKMVRCALCGILTPPTAMEDGICLDHREEGEWSPSPSAMAIRGAEYFHRRLMEEELPSESIGSLKAEIREFEKKSSESHRS